MGTRWSSLATSWQSLYGMDREALAFALGLPLASLAAPGSGRDRTKDLMSLLYRAADDEQRAAVPRRAAAVFGEGSVAAPLSLERYEQSPTDRSLRMVMRLHACGQTVESVIIPERGRLTLCLSTQVGCAQGCRFCMTGVMGLLRQLSAAEIVYQVLAAQRLWSSLGADRPEGFGAPRVTNVVFMGMGEPLDNVDNVLVACRILTDPWGLSLAPSRVTVSTVGLTGGLRRLLAESTVQVAWSLHTPFDEERSRLVPANRQHSIDEVLTVLRSGLRKGAHVFVQMTLMRGVNDSPAHAAETVRRLEGLPCKINLIPLNEHGGASFRRPTLESVAAFRRVLCEAGFVVTVRLSRGGDIQGACGQLVRRAPPAHAPAMPGARPVADTE